MLCNFILSIELYVPKKVLKAFWTIGDGPVIGKTGFPRVSSLLHFLAEFPSGAWRLTMYTYLPRLLRSTQEGAQGGAPPAIQEDTSGLT